MEKGERHKARRRVCPVCRRVTAVHANGTVYAHFNTQGRTCRASFTNAGKVFA